MGQRNLHICILPRLQSCSQMQSLCPPEYLHAIKSSAIIDDLWATVAACGWSHLPITAWIQPKCVVISHSGAFGDVLERESPKRFRKFGDIVNHHPDLAKHYPALTKLAKIIFMISLSIFLGSQLGKRMREMEFSFLGWSANWFHTKKTLSRESIFKVCFLLPNLTHGKMIVTEQGEGILFYSNPNSQR